MKTYLAPTQRLDGDALAVDVRTAVENPVIDGLLQTASGLLAVLNSHRQVLAVNDSFLQLLGIEDARHALGLRPGEAIGCIYHHVNAGGCGTSEYCETCGAAIAMASCLESNTPTEKTCAITVNRSGEKNDLFLRVRACPITVEERRLILLFLQDITQEQQWEAFGRTFFHDLSNTIYGLVGSSEILLGKATAGNRELAERIHRLSLRLAREVQMQKHLNRIADADYQPTIQSIRVDDLFDELQMTFASHPAALKRDVIFERTDDALVFQSDFFLVVRVLINMVVNALEATSPGRSVRVWREKDKTSIVFYAWNHQPVADTVVKRLFQRNFSTKAGSGRGLGTYSMKLFGETFLGGKIGFNTSVEGGTTFHLRLPLSPPPAQRS